MSILVLRFLEVVPPPEDDAEPPEYELEESSLLEYEPPEDELELLSSLPEDDAEPPEDELEESSLLEYEPPEDELDESSPLSDESSEDELEPLSDFLFPLSDLLCFLEVSSSVSCSSSSLPLITKLPSLILSSILDCIASIISSEIFSIPLILSVAPSFKLTSIVLVDVILRLSTVIRLYAFNKSNAKLPFFLTLVESSSPTETFSSRNILLFTSFCITGRLLFNILSVSLSTSYLNSLYFSLFSGFNGLCSAGTIISP